MFGRVRNCLQQWFLPIGRRLGAKNLPHSGLNSRRQRLTGYKLKVARRKAQALDRNSAMPSPNASDELSLRTVTGWSKGK